MISAIPMAGRDFMRRFGDRLRDIRTSKGMSQEELADLAGLHRTHVSLIERGRRSVRLETLERLGRALGVQPAALLPSVPGITDGRRTRSSPR